MDRAAAASELDPGQRGVYDAKIIELAQHIKLYLGLMHMQTETLRLVPPLSSDQEWRPFFAALREAHSTGRDDLAVRPLGRVLLAYAQGDAKAFNRDLASYRQQLTGRVPDAETVGFEVSFNHFAPFLHCAYLYVVVFLLTCVSWLCLRQPLSRAALLLTVLILLVHSWALIARMYIQGRPPVTNLYSSAVFIGWGCVLLGIILEAMFRNGIGNVVAAVTGSLSMLIAHHLASGGDTLEMMQAVLDTNFWLATHVTCVTFGYAATFIAGFLGMVFIILGVFTRALDRAMVKTLGQMIYGVVCFATLLSFTGTVLGGIWADQSWGRFWGWDPKENGALLIVLMNALILHARWGGMVQQRGMAVLTICGNMVTGWSWFGTNQLGVGLHAYGFNNTLAAGLVVFWITQLAIIGVGLIPMRYWRSFAIQKPAPLAARRPKKGADRSFAGASS
jgi:ABC-type transport system involved in cytochrome c biogenesis permease subunit